MSIEAVSEQSLESVLAETVLTEQDIAIHGKNQQLLSPDEIEDLTPKQVADVAVAVRNKAATISRTIDGKERVIAGMLRGAQEIIDDETIFDDRAYLRAQRIAVISEKFAARRRALYRQNMRFQYSDRVLNAHLGQLPN